MNNTEIAKLMKTRCLVLDIETSSKYDLKTDPEKYKDDAECKWIGFYSYKYDKYYEVNTVNINSNKIKDVIMEHETIVSFNGIDFDVPILKNNNMIPDKYIKQVDCQVVLGTDFFKHKQRGDLMGYKFKSNSLKNMAKTMKLKTQKGDIDYKIFEKNEWNEQETSEIKKYLRADVEVTKQMFDKLFDFWLPFTEFISEKNVKSWSFLNTKIGPLVYKSACKTMGYDEDYGEKGEKTELGGRVIEPKIEEETGVWYVDVTSLYPHMYILFNLVDEVDYEALTEEEKECYENSDPLWHGNEVFKVKGYYYSGKQHKLTLDLLYKLKERIRLKEIDKNDPLVYAYKIYLNTFYGITRSKVFKNTYKENAGSDCCYLGQQIHELMENMLAEKGYKTLAGDTDGLKVKHSEEKTKEQVLSDLKEIVDYILKYVPFPSDTFNIDIENFLHYIMWVPDEKTGKYKKKNYAYIYTDKKGNKKVEVMGLPVKKNNATELGPLIFHKYIEPKMIEENKGKFDSMWINEIINLEVKKNLELMAIEYNTSPYKTYSFAGKKSLYGQISREYCNELGGRIKLIKNKRIGKVGGAFKYCSLEEAEKYNLKVSDIDLKKVFNELTPFTKGKISIVKNGFFNSSKDTNTVQMKLKSAGYF